MAVADSPAALAAVVRECHALERQWDETIHRAEAEHRRKVLDLEVIDRENVFISCIPNSEFFWLPSSGDSWPRWLTIYQEEIRAAEREDVEHAARLQQDRQQLVCGCFWEWADQVCVATV
jgi:hypothetical protein